MARSQWFFCNDCQVHHERTDSFMQENSDYEYCPKCHIKMEKTRKPKDEGINHTQVLQYMIMNLLVEFSSIFKDPLRLSEQSEREVIARLLDNTLEQLISLDDAVSKLRRYPIIRDELLNALQSEIPFKEWAKNKWRDLDL